MLYLIAALAVVLPAIYFFLLADKVRQRGRGRGRGRSGGEFGWWRRRRSSLFAPVCRFPLLPPTRLLRPCPSALPARPPAQLQLPARHLHWRVRLQEPGTSAP